jgi:8-oxo-dGTP pyrophosphatase MutT (NUDIX family)
VSVAEAQPASTVVLARPASGGFEVFLVRRRDSVAFMGGAHVFPGGRVDPHDRLDDAGRWCDGVREAVARMPSRERGQAVAFHVAAVRELFEEAGVLLARENGGRFAGIHDDVRDRFHTYRRELIAGRSTMLDIVERERLRLALDALALFAHWVTPEIETRRFDTCFFLAVAPPTQDASHDEGETTDGIWMTPVEATERCLRGDIALPPPTWTTLRALARFTSVDDAWTWACAQEAPRVQPRVNELPDGTREILLPGHPRHPAVGGFEARETRFVMKDGRWLPAGRDERG